MQNLSYSATPQSRTESAWSVVALDQEIFNCARTMNAKIMAAAAVALASASVSAVSDRAPISAAVSTIFGASSSDVKGGIYREILHLTQLPDGWDGQQEDVAPSETAARDAINFVEKLPPFLLTPEVMAASDGELGLFWSTPDLYLNVSFFGDGRMAYFGEFAGSQVKGEHVTSLSHGIPADLASFMSRLA